MELIWELALFILYMLMIKINKLLNNIQMERGEIETRKWKLKEMVAEARREWGE